MIIPKMAIASCVLCISALMFFLFRFLFPSIYVSGYSMSPTYQDGQIIRSTRLYLSSRLKVGDVCVFDSPTGNTAIKRISNINLPFIFFEGDNQEDSTDSRNYGWVNKRCIISKIVNPRRKEF